MGTEKTIVLVLRSGGDFSMCDVELISRHIQNKWKSPVRPRVICLWDKASTHYNIGNVELMPLVSTLSGTWARMQLYSPEMEQYRPFLYIDLDTAIIKSLENIFDLIKDDIQFITLEDFWQKGQLATALAWIPAKSEKVTKIWSSFKKVTGFRMDHYIRTVTQADVYWQRLTNTIHDFKPNRYQLLSSIPDNANLICFHGKPRIFDTNIPWVVEYRGSEIVSEKPRNSLVTIIIPYNKDRGWLKDAVASVPKDVQLILSQGEGNWPENFNKVLPQAEGEYIRYLHEDDMLTPNCIKDSVDVFEKQDVDFIHGNAITLNQNSGNKFFWAPPIKNPTLASMLELNTIHSATTMYRREVFDKIGCFNEKLNTAEEYEFHLRCLKAGLKIGYVPNTLAIYRRHSSQKVRTVDKEAKKAEREMVRNWYR